MDWKEKDWNDLLKDTYREADVIIPPSSMMDGTAPVEDFMKYVSSPDMQRLRVCDYLVVMKWYVLIVQAVTSITTEQLKKR